MQNCFTIDGHLRASIDTPAHAGSHKLPLASRWTGSYLPGGDGHGHLEITSPLLVAAAAWAREPLAGAARGPWALAC